MARTGIDDLIGQLRAAEALAAGRPVESGAGRQAARAGAAEFTDVLKAALEQVNTGQQRALELSRSFETGDREVALHEVMLSMQKANIAFQATVQVRNRLVSAYQDIMNMPI